MKQLLIITTLAACIASSVSAQVYSPDNKFGTRHNRSLSIIDLGFPNDTLSVPYEAQSYPHISMKGSTLYVWDTVAKHWSAFVGGISTRDRFGFNGEDNHASEDRSFSGRSIHSLTIDSTYYVFLVARSGDGSSPSYYLDSTGNYITGNFYITSLPISPAFDSTAFKPLGRRSSDGLIKSANSWGEIIKPLARTAISLTTNFTSGVATYDNTSGVLNIPEYKNKDSLFGVDDNIAAANRAFNANSKNFWLTAAADVYLESINGTNTSWIDLANNEVRIQQSDSGTPSTNWIDMTTNQFELNQTGATSDYANSISMDGDNGILIDPGSGNFRISNLPVITSPTGKKVIMQGSGGYFFQISVADLTTGTANIYNINGKTTNNRVDSLDGHTLTFLGTGSNYPAIPNDTVRFKNTAVIHENSLVTNRLTDIIISGNNYGSYDATNYAGSIFFRHYGAYATGCDICGKNTMAFKWTQNAAWDPVTGTGGVDTLLHGQGAHNGPGDHHYYYGDFTDTYANANRLITFEHNGTAFIRIYNNPVGNFAQTLFGLSSNTPNYTSVPNWENWDVIIGGKAAVTDTFLVAGVLKITSGSPGLGKVLTSDANGVATWQTASGGSVSTFAFTDGHGLDGTVSNATTTPALSIITTAANKSVLYSASGDFTASMMSQESGYMLVSSSGSSSSTANASFVINSHEDNDAILDLQASGSPLFTFQDNGTLTIVDAGGDPSTPAAGFGGIYVKNDSLRFMNDAGTIFTLGTSGGGGGSGTVNSGVDKHAVMYSGTGTTVDDVAGAVYNTSSKILTISGQASGDVELKVIGNPSEDANLLELARFGGGTTVSWNQYGDLTVEDRVTAYKYSGNVYGGWHPSQGGFMVTPGVGYCFTNAANFNTIDASWQRKASGVIWAVDGGLGATGYSSVIMKQLIVGSGSTFAASATAAIHMYNGTVPSGSITDGTLLYSEDVSASSELKVRDEAGNITTLSPHNFTHIPGGPSEDMAWSYNSEKGDRYIAVDWTKALRTIEKQSKDIEDLKAMVNKLAGKTYQKKKPVKLVYTGKVNNKTK
jgi:hypothetical protein